MTDRADPQTPPAPPADAAVPGGVRIVDAAEAGWSDARGWGVRPLHAFGRDQDEAVECHVVSLGPGAVRGNHLHPDGTEWMLLFGGPVELAWREPGATEVRRRTFGAGPVAVELPPGTAHAVRGRGETGESYLVAFSDRPAPVTERCDPPLLS